MTWMRLWRGPRRSHAASVRQSRCARSRTTPTNPKTECLVSVDQATIGQVFRENSGRSVAALIRVFGDIDVAEDAVQEAFTVALRRWPTDGLPPNPGAWITTTARNRRLRSSSSTNWTWTTTTYSTRRAATCCGDSDVKPKLGQPMRG